MRGYRAYIKSLGWMVPVQLIDFKHKYVEADLSNGEGDTAEYDFDEIELMQYTGLKDCNGKEIFKGDVVNVTIHDWNTGKVLIKGNSVVQFRDGKFGFEWGYHKQFATFDQFTRTTFEVVGNIYEDGEQS